MISFLNFKCNFYHLIDKNKLMNYSKCMKNLKLIIFVFIFSVSSFAAIKKQKNISLNINLQRLNLEAQSFKIKLPENKVGSIKKEVNKKTKTITAKAIKLTNDTYRVDLTVLEMGKVIATPQLIVKNNTEALYQTFDSEGNSDLKLVIKID